MSDSGMSGASSGPSSGLSDTHDHKSDELEEEIGKNETMSSIADDGQKQLEDAVKPAARKSKMTSCNPYLSKSVMDLVGSSSPYLSPSISRSGSTCSIASSSVSTSTVTAMEIRTLTNNFQKLLKQATAEIKKLNKEKAKLEQEQEKLLTTNVELAVETKQLLLNQKEWKSEKQDLMVANEELASEVDKLYKAEEQESVEREKLTKELEKIQNQKESEKKQVNHKLQDEKSKLEMQIHQLSKNLELAKLENEKLLSNRKTVEQNLHHLQEDKQTIYEETIKKSENTISWLQDELAQEKVARENSELEIRTLSQELEKAEQELKALKIRLSENQNLTDTKNKESIIKLKEQNENLTAENFEYAVENDALKKRVNEQLEREKKIRNEIGQLRVENQWLINNKKNTGGKVERIDENAIEIESLKKELREEKEKVQNLTTWKSQLMEKNKELKEDNARLLTRTEDLEHLMNDEVTDINEILTVIKTIQVDKNLPELKNQQFF